MKTDRESALEALKNSQLAIQQGNRQAARRWAERAAAFSPDLEEPWLILASVASPRASVTHLKRALRINPDSVRARRGMQWAVDRLLKETRQHQDPKSQSNRLGQEDVNSQGSTLKPLNQSPVEYRVPIIDESYTSLPEKLVFKSLVNYRWSFLSLIVISIFLTAIWAFSPGNAAPVLAILRSPLSKTMIFGAPNKVDKPTYTPTYTPTFTPTNTLTPTATFTYTPTLTATFTPTETFTPTLTPLPTNTPRPWPTNTPFSYPNTGGVHWIDVNLSQQMLYAYEGDTVVASFLVSTGVPAFPTVTGKFHIYIKLVSTLMAGDGYYLPNVPYTMYFYKGYGIHGTYWHNNFGHPMSHGCVNMYTPDAKWMFYWASEGTLVNIHY
jgi:lipoprotein-anchoring transpeptidase ErfK/SrfK